VTPQRSTRRATLATLGVAGLAAGSAALVIVLGGNPAVAASDTSAAFALSATGIDTTGQVAATSSSGAIQTAAKDSFASASGSFTATGLSSSAGAGTATAKVGDLVVAGLDLGAFSATCTDGKVTVQHGKTQPDPARKIHVNYGSDGSGSGAAATVIFSGAGGAADTIVLAHVECAQSAPPPTGPPPSSTSNPPPSSSTTPVPPPTGPPPTGTSAPGPIPTTMPGSGGGTGGSGGTPPAAPAPTPSPGRMAVTG